MSIRFARGGHEIQNIVDWRAFAPPKRPKIQWKDQKSAMESARAWCGEDGIAMPPEIRALLDSHPDIAEVVVSHGEPEGVITFDGFGGEGRNADIILVGELRGCVAITIEAKVDEPFGATFQETMAASVERMVSGEHSNGLKRAEVLACSLLPPRPAPGEAPRSRSTPTVGRLRYQLLTAVAGTLAFAHKVGADRAVLIVHELNTVGTHDARPSANARDLNAFVHRLTNGTHKQLESGKLVGPVSVKSSPFWPSVPLLYIGKTERTLKVK